MTDLLKNDEALARAVVALMMEKNPFCKALRGKEIPMTPEQDQWLKDYYDSWKRVPYEPLDTPPTP